MKTTQLDKYGPFGKYNEVVAVSNGNRDFSSGSNVGAAAIMISASSAGAQNGSIDLARGGSMRIEHLSAGVIHEIGVMRATADDADTTIFVLKR
tara:strand:+ start:105 stop:386 length:282 start_codon:yes stop_codon:yes gene_type:complete